MFFAAVDALNFSNLIKGAGVLVWPLLLCFLGMVFIVFERTYALRNVAVMPPDLVDAVINSRQLDRELESLGERLGEPRDPRSAAGRTGGRGRRSSAPR